MFINGSQWYRTILAAYCNNSCAHSNPYTVRRTWSHADESNPISNDLSFSILIKSKAKREIILMSSLKDIPWCLWRTDPKLFSNVASTSVSCSHPRKNYVKSSLTRLKEPLQLAMRTFNPIGRSIAMVFYLISLCKYKCISITKPVICQVLKLFWKLRRPYYLQFFPSFVELFF